MTPVYLKFAGIGPYVDEQEIDFRKLNGSKVFLISGATGAGKTYILDCMMQALYGESAGGARNELSSLRCQFADAKNKTFIEFYFRINGKIYEFARSLRQIKKRDNTEEYEVECDAFLIENGIKKPFFENPTKTGVIKLATELIGLDAEQFRQVVILPQGKFESFLTSSTDDKTRILKTLFGTKKWEIITDNIRKRSNDTKNNLEKKNSVLKTELKNENCENIEQFEEQLSRTQEEKNKLEDELKLLEKELDSLKKIKKEQEELASRFDVLKSKIDEESELENQKDGFNELKAECSKNQKAIFLKSDYSVYSSQLNDFSMLKNEYAENAAALKELCDKAGSADKNLEEAKKSEPELENNRKKVMRLTSLKDNYSVFADEKVKTAEIVARFNESENKYSACSENVDNLKKTIKETEDAISRVNNFTKDEYNRISEYIKDYEKFSKEKQESEKNSVELKAVTSELEELFIDLNKTQDELNVINREYDELFEVSVENAKQEIINSLKVGEKCPVCGEVVKMKPNIKNVNDTEDFAVLKRRRGNLLDKINKINENLMNGKMRKSEIEAGQKLFREKFPDCLVFKRENYDEAILRQVELKTEIESFDVLQKRLVDAKGSLESAEKELRQLKSDCDTALKEKTVAETNLVNIEKSLEQGIENVTELESEILKLKNAIILAENALNDARAYADKLDANVCAGQKNIDELKQKLINKKEQLDEDKAVLLQKASKDGFTDLDDFKIYLINEQDFTEKQQKINDYFAKLNKVKSDIEELRSELNGKVKPDIQPVIDKFNKVSETFNKSTEIFGRMSEQCERRHLLIEKLRKQIEQIENLVDENAFLREYSDNLNGIGCISFQSYVLSKFLSAVAGEANRFLLNVDNGRYNLCVDDEKVGKERKFGLNLSVFDAYSSQKRSVQTLSGGEKFLVSLSLCLGLSAVVQAQSGGVRIEAMFIDEGFGTLSGDALESSIKILTEIADSKQIVGVISHVDKLKESLSTKIIVEKGARGSNLRLQI